MAHSHKLYTSSATQKPENKYLEECTFMVTSNAGNNKMCLGVHEESDIFARFNQIWIFSRHIFTGVITWKLHEILSTERRVDKCGQTQQTKQLFLPTVLTHLIKV
jgi:hypothetical protein